MELYKAVAEGKGGIVAKVVADSVFADATDKSIRLTTLELKYPRFIHSEFMTHRLFSRNASSSRAIPVIRMVEQVEATPAHPIHWGKNQKGMQASEELQPNLPLWEDAAATAAGYAMEFDKLGYHKQIVNRITEPYQFIRVVCTATEWINFFNLRMHEDAQPEIYELATRVKQAMSASTPESLEIGEWHTPYVKDQNIPTDMALRASVARCARVSYLNHDQTAPDLEKDVLLHDRLSEDGHLSPFEHVATPAIDTDLSRVSSLEPGATHVDRQGTPWSGNFRGWIQYRHLKPYM